MDHAQAQISAIRSWAHHFNGLGVLLLEGYKGASAVADFPNKALNLNSVVTCRHSNHFPGVHIGKRCPRVIGDDLEKRSKMSSVLQKI